MAEVMVCIDFRGISLTVYDDGKMWLEKPDGEGMEPSVDEVEQFLKNYYRLNF